MTGKPATPDARSHDIPDFPAPRSAECPFAPSPDMRALSGYGPLTRVRSWGGSTPWAVTGHAEQKALLSDPRLSVQFTRPGFPSPVDPAHAHAGGTDLSFVGMDDPEHARLRRMVSGTFTIKRVEAMRPRVQQMTDDFIDAMLAGSASADLVQDFALPIPSLVISELLGVPYEDHEFFQTNSKTIVSAVASPRNAARPTPTSPRTSTSSSAASSSNPGTISCPASAHRSRRANSRVVRPPRWVCSCSSADTRPPRT